MKTPVEVLITVANTGGCLEAAGDRLRMFLPRECPLELKDDIRRHKVRLLNLMGLTFVIVRSGVLCDTVFFVPDGAARQSLILAGAKPGNIYTKEELGTLVACKVTPKELRLIHSGKQHFNAEVRN